MRFERARSQMVQGLREGGITDERVLEAFSRVPREHFIPEALWSQAYGESPLPIGERQTISQPLIVGSMLQLLQLTGHERVLEIGVGSGYATALLACLCRWVYGMERIPALARGARQAIESLDLRNVLLRSGDGTLGWREYAPFDAILVSAAAPSLPEPLLDQLSPGGRLIIPVGDDQVQQLCLVTSTPEGLVQQGFEGCRFVPLIGRFGWEKI